jgi:hypothetical protein
MHDVVDGDLSERDAVHEGDGHGVERDVNPAGVGGDGIGVRCDGGLVERVDLRQAGDAADVRGDLLEPGARPPGEIHAGARLRKRKGDRAADRAATAVDHCRLAPQHHRVDLLRSWSERVSHRCRHRRSEKRGAAAAPRLQLGRCRY